MTESAVRSSSPTPTSRKGRGRRLRLGAVASGFFLLIEAPRGGQPTSDGALKPKEVGPLPPALVAPSRAPPVSLWLEGLALTLVAPRSQGLGAARARRTPIKGTPTPPARMADGVGRGRGGTAAGARHTQMKPLFFRPSGHKAARKREAVGFRERPKQENEENAQLLSLDTPFSSASKVPPSWVEMISTSP